MVKGSFDDLQQEAEAELRRAGGLGNPQPDGWRAGTGGFQPRAGQDSSFLEDSDTDEYASWTPADEQRAVTGFAQQQLSERGLRPAPARRTSAPTYGSSSSPEAMRARALAEILERQKRLARDRPVEQRPNPARHTPSVAERARAAPTLTAAPMVNLPRAAGVPRDSGARGPKGGSPVQPAPSGGNGGIGGRQSASDNEGPRVTLRRGVTRRSGTAAAGTVKTDGARADATAPPVAAPPDPVPSAPGPSVSSDDALAATSHATLSAIAVLLASTEMLPAPVAVDAGQGDLYREMTDEMRRLSVLLERYLTGLAAPSGGS